MSLSVSVSLFWWENDADNPAKRLSASFFCAGLLPVITPHPGTLHLVKFPSQNSAVNFIFNCEDTSDFVQNGLKNS